MAQDILFVGDKEQFGPFSATEDCSKMVGENNFREAVQQKMAVNPSHRMLPPTRHPQCPMQPAILRCSAQSRLQ